MHEYIQYIIRSATQAQVDDLRTNIINYINGDKPSRYGLCQYFDSNKKVMGYVWLYSDMIQNACKNWEHFSGYVTFPIKGENGIGAHEYYRNNSDTLHVGNQGRLRVELCKRMLVELDKVIILEY